MDRYRRRMDVEVYIIHYMNYTYIYLLYRCTYIHLRYLKAICVLYGSMFIL